MSDSGSFWTVPVTPDEETAWRELEEQTRELGRLAAASRSAAWNGPAGGDGGPDDRPNHYSRAGGWEWIERGMRPMDEQPDVVNHPSHYTDVVPGVECIQVTEHFGFLRGNAIKYLWRAGSKGDPEQDLLKAKWYIDRELANLEAGTW